MSPQEILPEYDHETAILLAKFSDEAYKAKDEFNIPNYEFKFVQNEKFINDTQVYVAKHSQQPIIVIAFRGTEMNWKDWLTDVHFLSSGYTYSKWFKKWLITLFSLKRVHSGFFNAYKTVRSDVYNEVKKLLPDNLIEAKVLVTGHSLGATLATLCALDLKEKYPQLDINLYTYGSPRVGNKHFVNYFKKKIKVSWRIVNDKDIVPSVPPRFSFLKQWIGYRHIPHFKFIDSNGQYVENQAAEEIITSPLKLIEDTLNTIFVDKEPLNDHYSGKYYDRLSEMNI